MFKKLLFFIITFITVTIIAGCDRMANRTYKADGVFTALSFEKTSAGGPQLSFASVTIENDKVTAYSIDSYQSTATKNINNEITAWNFNSKSKKSLGFEYGMHKPSSGIGGSLSDETVKAAYIQWLKDNNKLEWHEQAKLIEEHFVKNGLVITVDAEGDINNIAGVTISDSGYVTIAEKAVQNAKEGVTYVFSTSQDDVTFIRASIDKNGQVISMKIDSLQGVFSTGSTFSWSEKTKQQLGYTYGMLKPSSGITGDLNDAAVKNEYITWLRNNNKYEWFEQVDKLAEYVLNNGINQIKLQENGKIDLSESPEALAGVTINSTPFIKMLQDLYSKFDLKTANK